MTGPEHYRAAEDYLQDAAEAMATERTTDAGLFLDFAKAHATLAQTAATATEPARLSTYSQAYQGWADVALPQSTWRCAGCDTEVIVIPGEEPPATRRCAGCTPVNRRAE